MYSTTIVDSQDENVRSILSVDSGHPPSISSLNDSGSSFDSNQEVFLSSFDNSLTSAARRVHKCRRVDPQTINSLCARLEEAVYLSRKTRELTMTNGGEGSDDPCPSSSHEVSTVTLVTKRKERGLIIDTLTPSSLQTAQLDIPNYCLLCVTHVVPCSLNHLKITTLSHRTLTSVLCDSLKCKIECPYSNHSLIP